VALTKGLSFLNVRPLTAQVSLFFALAIKPSFFRNRIQPHATPRRHPFVAATVNFCGFPQTVFFEILPHVGPFFAASHPASHQPPAQQPFLITLGRDTPAREKVNFLNSSLSKLFFLRGKGRFP